MKTSILITVVATQSLILAEPLIQDQMIAPPAIINETPSMQKGLYVRTGDAQKLKRGAIVAMPMPKAARDYLVDKLGYPSDTLLIKRVVGMPGDIVCRKSSILIVSGQKLQAKDQDTRGNALPNWQGCQQLSKNEVFLLGDHPGSFDSRYFGPVSRKDLSGTYRQVFSW